MTPKRNTYWFLDNVSGWRESKREGLSLTEPDGHLILDPLPGSAVFVDSQFVGGVRNPVALASDTSGRIVVLDAADSRLTAIDLSAKTARPITAFGGPGAQARFLQQARGIAVLPSGAIAVADTGNRRVQLFSAAPYMLLQIWESDRPWTVASDACGTLYVLDRGTRSVLKFRADGQSSGDLGEGVLTDAVDLAVSADGVVGVVNGRGETAEIVVFPKDRSAPLHVRTVYAPLSLAFDGSDNLFAGTADGLISKLKPDRNRLDGYQLSGEGVTDVDGQVTKLAWVQGHGLAAILRSADATKPARLAMVDPAGAYRLQGSFETQLLDSGIERCVWHRVQIAGSVPVGTSVLVESATGESADFTFEQSEQCTLAGDDDPDCLVQSAPGRYLRIRLTLRSSGDQSPEIRAIKVFFPRESYLQYLPAVFQEDEESRLFLDRFLSIFQTSFDNFDGRIDDLWQLFDPFTVADKYFPWLAGWLALPLETDMKIEQKRALLKTAFQQYLVRGTVGGLERVIQDYANVPFAKVLEHFRLRNWPFLSIEAGLDQGARLWSENLYRRLQLGTNSRIGSFQLTNAPEPAMEPFDFSANRFSVLFPAEPYTVETTKAKVQRVVEREKPAYAEAILCPIFPRLRVGIQATLGVDAVVGKVTPLLLGRMSTLSYDSVLSCSPAERDMHALGLSRYPRLGLDANVL